MSNKSQLKWVSDNPLNKLYIDGSFIDPTGQNHLPLVNPATEETIGSVSVSSETDVDHAVVSAKKAFNTFRQTSREERLALLRRILEAYNAHAEEFAQCMTLEMGTPISFSRGVQVPIAASHIKENIYVLKSFKSETNNRATKIRREPIGVCGLITPWNWPMLQVITKVAPAIAAGCTVVLKPSEYSPLSAMLFARVMDEAGVPAGVFNVLNGDGATTGTAISTHPEIDMVSFTGSTRAGILVAKNAADSVKRVHQELGGKSANIVLEDVDLEQAITKGVAGCYLNNGQSCSAPTRMFVPKHLQSQASEIAKSAAEANVVGSPNSESTTIGPVVNVLQQERVNKLIQSGIDEGAKLITGGVGRPDGLNSGFYIRPTVFAEVTQEMTIAREEIFGPVLSIHPYDDVEQAVDMANDSHYGLAAYVQSADKKRAREIASELQVGDVYINYPTGDQSAPFGDLSSPFGGYKRSGNGREYGEWGFEAFLEVKAVFEDTD